MLIPKRTGGERPLGIPTISDRIAQTVIKKLIEADIDKLFSEDSYGYRQGKSAHDALKQCRKRCWQKDWVIDLDIKGFFDNIDHDLLMLAVDRVVEENWIKRYIQRWLKANVYRSGKEESRDKGTPQGGVISPILSNLFLHYVFDKWMEIHHSDSKFERYADDIVIHVRSRSEAEQLMNKLQVRFESCLLQLHPVKSKIVYCKDRIRQQEYPVYSFDFLGFTFRPRLASNKKGMYYVGFLPGISQIAANSIRKTIRSCKLHHHVKSSIEDIAFFVNPKARGWINYYQLFNKRDLSKVFGVLYFRILKWIGTKYRLNSKKRIVNKLEHYFALQPKLFVHWEFMYPMV